MFVNLKSHNVSKLNHVVEHFFCNVDKKSFLKLRSTMIDILLDSYSEEDLINTLSGVNKNEF